MDMETIFFKMTSISTTLNRVVALIDDVVDGIDEARNQEYHSTYKIYPKEETYRDERMRLILAKEEIERITDTLWMTLPTL